MRPKNALVGVDIGGTKTAVLVSLKAPSVLDRVEFPTKPARGPGPALRLIEAGIRDLLAKHRLKPAAIGVSCGGPLDRLRGIIQAPPNLSTWVDVPIKAMLEDEFGVACRLENDANAGAVAEHRFGAGRGCRNMVFLTMGTGLGAGIIIDGRLYRGTNDFAGEIGHVRLSRSGPVGYHKAGSVEGWVSGGGMPQRAETAVKAALKRRQSTTLAELLQKGKPITAREVALAARKGDVVAARVLRSTGERLGAVLGILVDILNPEKIVIGGLAMRLGNTLLGPAREVMQREALPYSSAVCQIVPAQLGERIGDVAALCVAMGL
ncbi:MAG TPA: ROK family protein [Terriglobia bacterium]|nr:ROK family protein [Terriglobia bacterium]